MASLEAWQWLNRSTEYKEAPLTLQKYRSIGAVPCQNAPDYWL